MENPLISVIIPIYNNVDYLEECLFSVKEQTYTNIEVVLVDDGSVDGSREVCQRFIDNDDRFKLYTQKNQGVSAARNNGLQHAKGEYISFLDSDDVIDACYIECLYKPMKKHNINISVCDFLCFSAKPSKGGINCYIDIKSVDESVFQHSVIARVWGGMFSKKILENLKFDTELFVGEDLLFFCSALKRVSRIAILSGKFYFYRLHGESACHGTYNANKYTQIQAWIKVRELFSNNKRILRKIDSMFGMIVLGNLIGLKRIDKHDARILYLKDWMRKVFFDFMTVNNTMVKLRHKLLFVCMLFNDDLTIWFYEKFLHVWKRLK